MLAGAARAGVLAHRRSRSACDSVGVNSECRYLPAAGRRANGRADSLVPKCAELFLSLGQITGEEKLAKPTLSFFLPSFFFFPSLFLLSSVGFSTIIAWLLIKQTLKMPVNPFSSAG